MSRKFKPGDWVKLKGRLSSPKMEVIKYVPKKDPFLGLVTKDTYLECIWYVNGERKSKIFHQFRLMKLIKTGGLYKT